MFNGKYLYLFAPSSSQANANKISNSQVCGRLNRLFLNANDIFGFVTALEQINVFFLLTQVKKGKKERKSYILKIFTINEYFLRIIKHSQTFGIVIFWNVSNSIMIRILNLY